MGDGTTSGVDGRGPIHRASQVAFQRTIATRVPDMEAAGLALFVYAAGAGRMVDALLARVAGEHELDGSQFRVLFTLWCAPPPHRLSPTELHRVLLLSPSGMSHTLRRLHAGGLIRRRGDDTDGRARNVELTAAGIGKLQRCVADLAAVLNDVYGDVEPQALDDLADSQRRIAELFSRSPLSYSATARPLDLHTSDEPAS